MRLYYCTLLIVFVAATGALAQGLNLGMGVESIRGRRGAGVTPPPPSSCSVNLQYNFALAGCTLLAPR